MTNIKKWVLETQTKDDIRAIAEYKCINGACNDLIYYSDTVDFYDNHTEEIWEIISQQAEELDMNVLNYINSWDGYINSDTAFKDKMAWLAVEITCDQIMRSEEVA